MPTAEHLTDADAETVVWFVGVMNEKRQWGLISNEQKYICDNCERHWRVAECSIGMIPQWNPLMFDSEIAAKAACAKHHATGHWPIQLFGLPSTIHG